MQVFVGSPRTWAAPAVDREQARLVREAAERVDLHPIVIHTSYLINLGSADADLWQRSVSALVHSLAWGEELGAMVVTHLGSPGQAPAGEAEERVVRALETALEARPAARLLMETAAGQKRIGGRLDQLGRLCHWLEGYENLGVCIDTAHLFASGYDVATQEGLEATLAELDRQVGLDRLQLVHINDSMVPLGRGSDRHANAGQGYIGENGLALVLHHPWLRHLPFITEAPGFNDEGPDARNLQILNRLAHAAPEEQAPAAG